MRSVHIVHRLLQLRLLSSPASLLDQSRRPPSLKAVAHCRWYARGGEPQSVPPSNPAQPSPTATAPSGEAPSPAAIHLGAQVSWLWFRLGRISASSRVGNNVEHPAPVHLHRSMGPGRAGVDDFPHCAGVQSVERRPARCVGRSVVGHEQYQTRK